ncbi:MAG TPA: hypothetical protein GX509_01630 [Firmicutes bacterium]|nr:hypothetical protein [Bacillota bacterium]HHY97418.1 hypothetical protein [Bacillota bacterium]
MGKYLPNSRTSRIFIQILATFAVLIAGYYILWIGPERLVQRKIQNTVMHLEKEEARKPPRHVEMVQGAYDYNTSLMARVIYAEARGEPYPGQVGVGAVILNRVRSPLFPNTIPGVIFEPWAFTVVATGEIWWHTPDRTAYRATWDALSGWDPTGGALYYYNPARATSPWIWTRPPITRIGNHIFTR